jgi:hypothetical protein
MPNRDGLWTLGIQKNRDTGNKIYKSLRMYGPTNKDTALLRGRVEAKDGSATHIYYRAKVLNNGSRLIFDEVKPTTKEPSPKPNLAQRAAEIITIIASLGGTTTWPVVREKLTLPAESMPGPILVKALKERGMQTLKDPKTSTMIWKLIDREKLNGYTH